MFLNVIYIILAWYKVGMTVKYTTSASDQRIIILIIRNISARIWIEREIV